MSSAYLGYSRRGGREPGLGGRVGRFMAVEGGADGVGPAVQDVGVDPGGGDVVVAEGFLASATTSSFSPPAPAPRRSA